MPGDRPAHRDALAFAAGELVGKAVEEVLDAEHLGRGVDARARVLAGRLDAQREADVVAAVHGRVEREVLEDHRHVPVGGLQMVGVGAVEPHLSLGGVRETGDHPQHGRLAAAGRPEQHQELAGCDVERQPLHHRDTARVGLADLSKGDGA